MSLSHKLDLLIDKERENLPLWLPVSLAIGILLFFKKIEINILVILALIICSCASLHIFYRLGKFKLLIITYLTLLIALGYYTSYHRTQQLEQQNFDIEAQIATIIGEVETIIPTDQGFRIAIKTAPNFYPPNKRIRITIRSKLMLESPRISSGDQISVLASLSPPPKPKLPGGYDFSRAAFYDRIIATGFAFAPIRLLEKNKKTSLFIRNLRQNIVDETLSLLGNKGGSVATAMLVNEYAAIDRSLLEKLRISGLAHILSVSGMHITLVASIFFFIARFALSLSEQITLRFSIKKISAIAALFGSFFYLLLSGSDIAAVRAFIMTSMVIIAMLLDRNPSPKRSIAFAATIILLIHPEYLLHPSFQMSFFAVMALIASYEYFIKFFDYSSKTYWGKITTYTYSLIFSSLIAGLATAPFIAYHFGLISTYSIIANLIAVPITSFWIMPLVVIGFALYPFSMLKYALIPMNYGITLIIKAAELTSGLPGSSILSGMMPDIAFILICAGIVWLCLWQSRIKLAAIPIIAAGIIITIFTPKPDIIVTANGGIVFQRDDEFHLLGRISPFTKRLLLQHLSVKTFSYVKTDQPYYVKLKGHEVTLCSKFVSHCPTTANHLTVAPGETGIGSINFITEDYLKENGAIEIYLKDHPVLKTSYIEN